MNLRRALVLAVILAGAVAPAARADVPFPPSQWYGLPGLNEASGAQWVRAIAHGTPPNVVYAGLEGGGVFRSTTGGATWSAFNSGFPNPLTTNVRALLTSSTGTTVYAGTDDGIYKSTGGAWQPLAQGAEADPGNPKKLNQSVQSLVSLPGNVMLAGVFSGGVYKSPDGGSTWQLAELRGRNVRQAWAQWSIPWQAPPGQHVLKARATDSAGNTQPDTVPFNDQGYLFSGVVSHPVTVT